MCQRCDPTNADADQRAAASPEDGLRHGPPENAPRLRYKGRNWPGPYRRTPDRLFGMGLIRLYQLTLSGFIGNACRHLPTCSEYGYEAVGRYGLWPGGWMALFRVARCGPGGTSGIDRVPERLAPRFHWWTPWRYWSVARKNG